MRIKYFEGQVCYCLQLFIQSIVILNLFVYIKSELDHSHDSNLNNLFSIG